VRWEALPSISPLNGCLCVVLVADLRVGGKCASKDATVDHASEAYLDSTY